MKSVTVIAAHPDDEVLGCGGTIAKLTAEGAEVNVAFIADGVSSRSKDHTINNDEHALRQNAARKACDILGVNNISFGDMPDNRLDTIPLLQIVQAVERVIDSYKPDTILTHHNGDLNIDHQLVNKAVATACRPQTGHPVKLLLSFEVPSSTEWQLPENTPIFFPNWFIDISNTVDLKLKALEVYKDELRDWPHPRSIEGVKHLAHWRGATVGVNAAEAFVLARNII